MSCFIEHNVGHAQQQKLFANSCMVGINGFVLSFILVSLIKPLLVVFFFLSNTFNIILGDKCTY